jgi:hypothetical protein
VHETSTNVMPWLGYRNDTLETQKTHVVLLITQRLPTHRHGGDTRPVSLGLRLRVQRASLARSAKCQTPWLA